jgi:DNA-binding NarL/FixJ family response regulator
MRVDTDVVEGGVQLVCRPELLRLGLERLLADADGLDVTDQPAAVAVLCERDAGDVAAAVAECLNAVGREVVVVLAVADVHVLLDCIAAGANGFVLESDASGNLVAAVRAAAACESYLTPALLGLLLAMHRAQRTAPNADRTLLRLLAGGRPTAEIAGVLGVAPKTVRNRASRLYRRLGVRSRAQALEAAERRGLLD